jgi:hypothetical protein
VVVVAVGALLFGVAAFEFGSGDKRLLIAILFEGLGVEGVDDVGSVNK